MKDLLSFLDRFKRWVPVEFGKENSPEMKPKVDKSIKWHASDNSLECHSVLQCVAVCCSALQCVAVCCRVLKCAADKIRQ